MLKIFACPVSRLDWPCLQVVHFQFRFAGMCGDARSQQVLSGNIQSNGEHRCFLCTISVKEYVCHSQLTDRTGGADCELHCLLAVYLPCVWFGRCDYCLQVVAG